MKLLVLESQLWDVAAIINEDEDCCPLTDFLAGLESKYKGSASGMFDLFERFSQSGRDTFNDDLCHYVDKNEKIWEFIKGDIRVLWFYGQGSRIIVCSHGFLKNSRKTPKNEVNQAIAAKKEYEDAASRNKVVIVSGE